MRSGNRSNALLVELLIVVMFFMLSSTVLLQMFSAARTQSDRAALMIEALNDTQNIADHLYAAQDAETEMGRLGFEKQEDHWYLADNGYGVVVRAQESGDDMGGLVRYELQALQGDDVLFTLPVARYQEVQP